jgi:uncharacterized protein YxjI
VDFFGGRAGIGVNQKRKFVELRNQYTLTDDQGQEIGNVEQKKQSPVAFILRLVSSLDVMLPVTLNVTDSSDQPVLTLHKPWFKWGVEVSDATGSDLGVVKKQIKVGKAVFQVQGAGGAPFGHLKAENWRARDFRLEDTGGTEIGRVTKQWRGLLSEALTDADSYAVTFDQSASAETKALTLASALAVDLIMKQKDSS